MGGKIVLAPLNFESVDWIKFGSITAATSLAYFSEEEVRDYLSEHHNKFKDNIFSVDKDYFVLALSAGIAGVYGYGLFGKNTEIRKLGFQLGEATIYSTAVAAIFKFLAGRSRPYLDNGNNQFNPLTANYDQNSFYSGHSTFYFALSTVLAEQIDNFFWDAGWYSLAALVAVSRIYNDQHWFSDVILGAAMGHFIGEFVVNNSNNSKEVSYQKTDYFLGVNFINYTPVYTINFKYNF